MSFALQWRRIVDFIVLAYTLYVVLRWASRARALRVALAITALYAGVLLARQFDLLITAWILQGAALIAVALMVIVFQPEVRRALTRLDRTLLSRTTAARPVDTELAEAAFTLASTRTGALFVISGRESLDELLEGGVVLNADFSTPLVESIFEKLSPLHDGAVVLEGSRIARAGAVLPLTHRTQVPPEYGTRHRAAMGLAERTDALCIVVSEERGEVTVMRGYTATLMRTPQQLSTLLETSFARPGTSPARKIRGIVADHWRIKVAAFGLASLIWAAAIFDPSSTVRVVQVPIEFQNVPGGLDIVGQSATELSVQLRGRSWMLNANQISNLIARFDLTRSSEGFKTLPVTPRVLGLPPGVNMVHVTPDIIELHLMRHTQPPR